MYEKIQNVINQISVEGNLGLFNQSLTEEERQYFWNNINNFKLEDNFISLLLRNYAFNEEWKIFLISKFQNTFTKIQEVINQVSAESNFVLFNRILTEEDRQYFFNNINSFRLEDNFTLLLIKNVTDDIWKAFLISKLQNDTLKKDFLKKMEFENKNVVFEYYLNYSERHPDFDMLLKFDESLFTEDFIKNHADEIAKYIEKNNKEIPRYLQSSEVLLEYYLNHQDFNMISEFTGNVIDSLFIKEELKKHVGEIVKYIEKNNNNIPVGLLSSDVLFEYYLNHQDFDMLMQFNEKLFTREVARKHPNEIAQYIEKNNKEIPRYLQSSEALFEYYLNHQDFDMLIKFDIYFFKSYIEKNNKKLPSGLKSSDVVFRYCLNHQNFDALIWFDGHLFTSDIMKIYGEKITECIKKNNNELPFGLQSSEALFEYYLNHQDIGMLIQFNERLFTEEVVKKHADEIAKYIEKNNNNIPARLKSSEALFEYYLSHQNFGMLMLFSKSTFTEDVVKNHMEEIIEYIEKNYQFIPVLLQSSEALFEYYLNHHDLNMLIQFDNYFYGKESIQKYGEQIAECIEKNNNNIPRPLKSSEALFEYFLNHHDLNMLMQFESDFYSKESIQKYGEQIAECIEKNNKEIPLNLKSNKVLFEYFLNHQNFDILMQFDSNLFNEDVVKKHVDEIAQYIEKNNNNIPERLQSSKALFEYCLNYQKFDMLMQFDSNLFTEDVVKNHANEIAKCIEKNNNNIPARLKSSDALFEYCLNHQNFDVLIQLNSNLFTEEVVKRHIDEIAECIKRINNKIPLNLQSSEILFEYYLNHQNFDILMQFDSNLFTEDVVKKRVDEIAKCIEKNNDNIPVRLKSSDALFKYYLNHQKFGMLMHFDKSLLTDDFIKNHMEEIIKCIEKNNNKIPSDLKSNKALFEYCLNHQKIDMLMHFDKSLLTGDFIKNHTEEIIEYIKQHGYIIPYQFQSNKALFEYYLAHQDFNVLIQFDESLLTENFIKNHMEEIIEYIKQHGYIIPYQLYSSKALFEYLLTNGNLKRFCGFINLFYTDEVISNILHSVAISRENLDFKQIEKNFKTLLSRNDELLSNFKFEMLATDIPIKYIEILALYPDLQQSIINLSQDNQEILNGIIEFLDNINYDICPIIYSVLNNISEYKNLLSDLKKRVLSDEDLKILITVLSDKNYLNIESYNELVEYDDLILNRHKLECEKVLNDEDLPNILDSIFRYKFGLSLNDAKFLDERYCSDITIVQNGNLSDNLKETLLEIHKILNINDEEQLKFILLTSSRLKTDFYSTILLESSIRGELAKQYSDTLYKLKDSDKLDSSNVSSAVYTALNGVTYNDKKPNIFVLHDDFNLQIHVLGAYRSWERPENFKEDWVRPKIAYHGICTSYIGNNEIANARQYHPTYGFSHYEPNSLLCAGHGDLVSDDAILNFASSREKPYEFLPPKAMIDKTRHTHNEMVLERLNTDTNNNNFKRMPDYVVYFVDDINNLANFNMDKNNLFSETVQAAIDQDIPIVVVDRLYYAKREKAKCNALLEQFKNSLDVNTLKELLTQIANNMIGCAYYDTQTRSAYHDEFAANYLHGVIDEIILSINKKPLNIQTVVIKALNSIVDNDYLLKADEYLVNKLNRLNNIISQVQIDNDKKENANNQINIGNYLVDYYKNASPDIREQIKKDIEENELDYQAIYQKIINGEYETRMKGI